MAGHEGDEDRGHAEVARGARDVDALAPGRDDDVGEPQDVAGAQLAHGRGAVDGQVGAGDQQGLTTLSDCGDPVNRWETV